MLVPRPQSRTNDREIPLVFHSFDHFLGCHSTPQQNSGGSSSVNAWCFALNFQINLLIFIEVLLPTSDSRVCHAQLRLGYQEYVDQCFDILCCAVPEKWLQVSNNCGLVYWSLLSSISHGWIANVPFDHNQAGLSPDSCPPGGGGGRGGTPIYRLYGYVPHFRVWFSNYFSLK